MQAVTSWSSIVQLCEESINNNTASICIPPSYVKRVHDAYSDRINICTVIGFPLGYNTTEVKIAEATQAIKDGAKEIDMVVNLGDVKNGDFDKVTEEIALIKKSIGNHILKVIIETCYLTEKEKIAMCKAVTDAKADYIKTSTGFGTDGATMEDVLLFKEHIGPNVKIKAAGGVKTVEDLNNFIQEGCERIGTSSAIKILAEGDTQAFVGDSFQKSY